MAYTHKLSRRLAMLDGVCAVALLATLACSDDLPVAPRLTISPPSLDVSTSATVVLVGAGNIARCRGTYDEATATLLDGIGGTVYTLGDNTHHSGSSQDYANCFGGSWGRHKSRIRPTVGDNEYQTAGASGYFGYFGASAGPSGKGYYSYDLGDWHVVVLNSQISTAAGSAQEQWLRADLAASTKACTIGIWHEPRFSSYGTRIRADVKPLWDALYAAGAEIVLNGHYEHYERFALQRPDGTADAQRGIRQFIVGTGGEGTEPFGTPVANSQVRK
jgi:acid phosphatase type 7